MTLVLVLSYGSKNEILNAVKQIAEKIEDGELTAGSITQETIEANSGSVNMPSPDLLIRTSGEQRLSNFLLWQSPTVSFSSQTLAGLI